MIWYDFTKSFPSLSICYVRSNQGTNPYFKNLKSCINLTFTSQIDLIMDSEVHLLLHSNCHLQVICAKFDVKVSYPHPYENPVWHFVRVNSDHIKTAINLFD